MKDVCKGGGTNGEEGSEDWCEGVDVGGYEDGSGGESGDKVQWWFYVVCRLLLPNR